MGLKGFARALAVVVLLASEAIPDALEHPSCASISLPRNGMPAGVMIRAHGASKDCEPLYCIGTTDGKKYPWIVSPQNDNVLKLAK